MEHTQQSLRVKNFNSPRNYASSRQLLLEIWNLFSGCVFCIMQVWNEEEREWRVAIHSAHQHQVYVMASLLNWTSFVYEFANNILQLLKQV